MPDIAWVNEPQPASRPSGLSADERLDVVAQMLAPDPAYDDEIPCDRCGRNIEQLVYAVLFPPAMVVHDECCERYGDGQIDFDATALAIREGGGRG
jgi:hypothetical protein